MDDSTAFRELSALLTGKVEMLTEGLFGPVSDEYLRRLLGTFSGKLERLLDTYRRLAETTPKPPIDDVLLTALKATPEWADKDVEFVARQLVAVWYFSQFRASIDGELLDGGFYELGFVWPLIHAHPPGFSHAPHGYWAERPVP